MTMSPESYNLEDKKLAEQGKKVYTIRKPGKMPKTEVKKRTKGEGWGSSHDSKGNADWQEKMDRYKKMKLNGNINQIINKIIYSKKNDSKK